MIDILNNPVRIAIGNFLNIPIIQNQYVWTNIWSIVHLLAGFVIMMILLRFKLGSAFWKFTWLFLLLVIFEFFEYFAYTKWFVEFFIPEEIIDVIWDLIIGMFGALLAFIVCKCKNK